MKRLKYEYTSLSMFLEDLAIQRVTNHPIHIVTADGTLNPTALVPFCSVNNNYSAMGIKLDQIEIPVCNSFQKKIVRDQLCYSVDLHQIMTKNKFREKVFFSFFIDFNEDRSIMTNKKENSTDNVFTIETIGKYQEYSKI